MYDRALCSKPTFSEIYLHKALALSDCGKYDDAVATMVKAIQSNPTNPVYHMFRGRLHYDGRRFDKALKAFEKSLLMNPENSLTLSYKGLILLATGNYEDGYEIVKKTVNYTNSDFQGRLLAFCEWFLYQLNGPTKSLEETIREETRGLRSRMLFLYKVDYTLGLLLTRAKYYILDLVPEVLYVTNIQKRTASLNCLEGANRYSLGDFQAAVDAYEKALTLLPECDQAKERLAEIYFEIRNYKSSLKHLVQTKEYTELTDSHHSNAGLSENSNNGKNRNGSNPHLCLILGILYHRLGEHNLAIEKLTSLAKPDSKDYIPFYYLGLCYTANQDNDRARYLYCQATERLNPKIAEKRLDEMMRIYRSKKE